MRTLVLHHKKNNCPIQDSGNILSKFNIKNVLISMLMITIILKYIIKYY